MCRKSIYLVLVLAFGLTVGVDAQIVLKVNFQSQGAPIPEGYLPEYGDPFFEHDDGWSYGWDQNIRSGARDRNSGNAPDQRYDTLNHLQQAGGDKIWEIELPNGTYDVFLVCGDPSYIDQTNNFDVENVLIEDPDGQAGSGFDFDELNVTVELTDGRLTIKPGTGAANCKICFVHIEGEALTALFAETRDPNPRDGEEGVPEPILVWTPGATAVSQRVYFGTNPDDLQLVSEQVYSVYWHAEGIENGTRYYWRIDGIDADGAVITGPLWSFVSLSMIAWGPSPSDGATDVMINKVLSWKPGYSQFPVKHHLFFGTNETEVAEGTGDTDKGILEETTYDPGTLSAETIYYFRVDEIDIFDEVRPGDVWSFETVAPGPGKIIKEWWFDISGEAVSNLTNNARYPNDPDGWEFADLMQNPDNWAEQYGVRFSGWLFIPETGDYIFEIQATDEGEIRLSPDEDPANAVSIVYVDDTTDQSEPQALEAGNRYYIEVLMKEASLGDSLTASWQGPGIGAMQIISADYVGATPYLPVKAFAPFPADGAVDVPDSVTLTWQPGVMAAQHEVYFGMDKDAVTNATTASPEYKGTKALGNESYVPGKLEWKVTYYWRIDQVNADNPNSPWMGKIWSFTVADFIHVDDFEAYNADDNQIWFSWHDGLGAGAPGTPGFFAGNGTGSAVGDETTESYTEETIVHSGSQSMPLAYDNNKQGFANYSEVELTLTAPRDWTQEGVAELSLWFRGNPASVGSFIEGPTGTYTITATGADIWNEADEFHYAFKTLTGAGSIVAKVLSVDNTDPWAKAGVMIRETLGAGSKFAAVYITPGSGCSFQGRLDTDVAAVSDSAVRTTEQQAIVAPYWVKLERDFAGNFRAYYSSNGSTWISMTWNPQNISMSATVYVGLAVTSHNNDETCEAKFSNVTITGTVGPQWSNQDIGIASNDAEPLYVAVSNNAGTPAVVVHDDPAAANIDTWTEWVIPLQAFVDQGINLTNVDRIAVGLGTRGNMTVPGGSGKMYFDDIRLYRPRNVAGE
ncbi:MAG: PA14 domain-containing protein [Sedimentisphaerales bacterium]